MLEEQTIFANRYRLVKRLGQGAFSEVWKAEDTKTGNLTVALKVYAPEKGLDENGAKVFSEEFALVFNMSHQNLLTPSYFDEDKGSPYLVLPFCEKGSAMNLIGMVNEEQAARFLHDVSSALAYLHDNGVIHQDIKPDNVLIDATGNFKVTDFGISTKMRSTLRRSVGDKKGAGTMAYMGPERFSRNPETIKASDIWSLGATVYELMCGDVPFGDIGGGMQKGGAEIPEIQGNYPAKLKELVEKCLSKETWDRPTAAQIRDICDGYFRHGYWDLSSIKSSAPNKTSPNVSTHSRPTSLKNPYREPVSQPVQKPGNPVNPKPQPDSSSTSGDSKKSISIIGGIVATIAIILLAVFLVPNKEERIWKNVAKNGNSADYTSYVEQFPEGEHVKEAKTWLSNYYRDKIADVERNASSVIEELGNTWNDYESPIQRLNELWNEVTDISEASHHFNEEGGMGIDGQCYDIRIQMQTVVKNKLDAEETNLRLDPSEGTRKNISVLKSFHGYDVVLSKPY